MFTAIKKLMEKIKSQAQEVEAITYPSPLKIDFADLEHDFSKRTYSFDYYNKELAVKNPRLLHWIGSIDYSGYQREKSLKYLIGNYQPGDENRILLRLEDWVDCIQELSRNWLSSNFNKLSLEQINSQHRLILYLARKEKLCRDKAITTINEIVIAKTSESKNHIFYQLDTKLRRYIYNLEGAQNQQFRERILYDSDPFNRIILLKKFGLKELSKEELKRFKADKSSFVKRNFLYFQINAKEAPSREDLTRFCLDDNKGIRDLAKFYLQKLYGINPYDLFKQQKDHKYYFIADYVKKEDLEIFINGFNSENKLVKNLCFKAICNIDYSVIKAFDSLELINSSRKIRKLACQYLPKILSLKELQGLQREISNIGPKGQLIYLNMVYRKSIWQFINEALKYLINDPSEENMKFVSDKYHRKPYIYEKLDPQLKENILEKMQVLGNYNNYYIKSFIEHLSFTINTA